MSEYFPKNTEETDFYDLWMPENESSSDGYGTLNDNSDIRVALQDGDYAGMYWNEVRATAFEDLYNQDSLDLNRDTE